MAGPGDNRRTKPGGPVDTEPLRRAIGGCVRAVAGKPDDGGEIEVVFSAERPGMAGDRIRLPELSKRPDAREVRLTRGIGDAFALRKACHEPRLHAVMAPQNEDARGIFDAVEQARVESIGANRMAGVAQNLETYLDERLTKAN